VGHQREITIAIIIHFKEETMTEMNPKERAVYDARADREVWNYAWNLLEPLVDMAREVGHDELTQVMEKALVEVEDNLNVAADNLELAEAALRRLDTKGADDVR
jgi:hypothetical protein